MCSNLDGPQRRYSEQNKSVSKDYIAYDLYTILEITKLYCRDGTQISGSQGLGIVRD